MPPKKRAARAVPAETAAADDTEVSFPRGGADLLTPLEKKQLTAKAHAESAQENGDDAPRKKQKKSRAAADKQDDEQLFFDKAVQQGGKEKTYVELLKFKNVVPGMKLLGLVVEVSQAALVLSLPHGLRASVTAQEASDVISLMLSGSSKEGALLRGTLAGKTPTLPALFRVGQYVRCCILEPATEGQAANKGADGAATTGKKKKKQAAEKKASKKNIQASLLLSRLMSNVSALELSEGLLLPAYVRTVEEHGYTLGFGLKGVRGFLRVSEYEAVFGAGERLAVGRLLDVVVKDCSDKRSVTVSVNPMEVSSVTATTASSFTLPGLLPGTLVPARVGRVLVDGLQLSFLTYFQGTVDKFHLPDPLPNKDLGSRYNAGDKLKARVLFVDSAENKVGLSLVPHVVSLQPPAPPVVLGDVLSNCVVHRVDADLGLLLQLPSSDPNAPKAAGFVHVSNLSEEHVENPGKIFKVGQKVTARVIGFRLLEGLAVMSMKHSVLSRQVVSYKDIYPGMLLEGSAATLADYGLLVDISSSIRALVPTLHLTDAPGVAPKKSKFKEGLKVHGRVLDVDPATKRVTLTLKKGLVESKLPAFCRLEDLSPGMKAHGWVTRVQDFGVFIAFYNGLKGMAHVSDAGLVPGQRPAEAFQEGQVVRAHVLAVDLAQQRLKLSLVSSQARQAGDPTPAAEPVAGLANVQPGKVVAGVVTRIEENGEKVSYYVRVEHEGGSVEGVLDGAHLSDHPGAVDELKGAVKVGAKLPQLLVLECKEQAPHLQLTRKASMIAAAHNLPTSFDQIKETAILPGYVASVTNDAVYVRFLNRVTGRAGLAQLADTFVSVPSNHYCAGQSVWSVVVTVDAARQRFNLALKPSLVAAPPAAYLHSLFRDLEFAEELRASEDAEEEGSTQVEWSRALSIGSVVAGQAHDVKEFGVMCDLEAHPDVVGLALPEQAPADVKVGCNISGRVLDVSKGEGIVDLTLLPQWMAPHDTPAKKKRKESTPAAPLQVGTQCSGTVVLKKEHYAVLVLPQHSNALGFVTLTDFNKQQPGSTTADVLAVGKTVSVVVAVLPEPSSGGRLLLTLPTGQSSSRKRKAGADDEVQKKQQKAEEKALLKKGALVEGSVESVSSVGLCVQCKGHVGRVHASEVDDWSPSVFAAGQQVRAVVLGKAAKSSSGKRRYAVDLSLRAAVLAAATAGEEVHPIFESAPKPGSTVVAYVTSVSNDHLMASVTQHQQAYIARLDAVQTPGDARKLQDLFKLGQQLTCRVLRVQDKKPWDLSLREVDSGSSAGSCTSLKPGMLAVGHIKACSGTGVTITLGKKLTGRVALTDLADVWRDNALTDLKAGLFVVCRVLEDVKSDKVGWVSLRPSQGGQVEGLEPAVDGLEVQELSPEDIKPAQTLPAYVKTVVEGKGAFVVLSRGVEARIKLKDLADGFVKEPKKEFPAGKLVRGRVVAVGPEGRIDMTLKSAAAAARTGRQWMTVADLKAGSLVAGTVRNVREFGVFVEIANSSVVGLAHISECSDEFVQDPGSAFKVGQAVRAVVTKINEETQKVSLSMKKSSLELAQQAAAAEGAEEEAEEGQDMEAELVDALDEDEEGEGGVEGHNKQGGQDEQEDEDEGSDSEEEEADKGASPRQKRSATGAVPAAGSSDDEEDEDDEDDEDGGDLQKQLKALGLVLGEKGADYGEDDEDGGDESEEEEGNSDGGAEAAGVEQGRTKRSRVNDTNMDEEDESEGEEDDKSAAALYSMLRSGPLTHGWEELELEAATGGRAAGRQEAAEAPAAKADNSRKLKKKHAEKERQIHEAELARMQGDREPKSADDFELLVVSSPDSSLAWIKYMAFLISVGDIEKARSLAERAIQTINYRAEDEKFNVWVAWLNMENLYGQPDTDQAAMNLFNKALAFTDPKKLFLAFCGILQRTNKHQLLEQVTKAMLKKFPGSAKVWLLQLEGLIRSGNRDRLAATLDRAVQCLAQRKHIKVMSKAALLEFKLGDAERGRSMLEGILLNYPKRLDLWNLYLDQEIKQGDKQRIRGLFERATHLQLPAKKMKFMFKKYLAYEKQHGDANTVEHVKKCAMEFVEQSMGA